MEVLQELYNVWYMVLCLAVWRVFDSAVNGALLIKLSFSLYSHGYGPNCLLTYTLFQISPHHLTPDNN